MTRVTKASRLPLSAPCVDWKALAVTKLVDVVMPVTQALPALSTAIAPPLCARNVASSSPEPPR